MDRHYTRCTADGKTVSAKCLQEDLLVIQSRDVRLTHTHTHTKHQLSLSDKILQLLQSSCVFGVGDDVLNKLGSILSR